MEKRIQLYYIGFAIAAILVLEVFYITSTFTL